MENNPSNEPLKLCVKCGGLYPISKFYSNPKTKDKLKTNCKYCECVYYRRNYHSENYQNIDGMFKPVKDDYYYMYKVLLNLGYDIKGNVAEQFSKKYNLKYRKRWTKNMNKYSPEDFDFS